VASRNHITGTGFQNPALTLSIPSASKTDRCDPSHDRRHRRHGRSDTSSPRDDARRHHRGGRIPELGDTPWVPHLRGSGGRERRGHVGPGPVRCDHLHLRHACHHVDLAGPRPLDGGNSVTITGTGFRRPRVGPRHRDLHPTGSGGGAPLTATNATVVSDTEITATAPTPPRRPVRPAHSTRRSPPISPDPGRLECHRTERSHHQPGTTPTRSAYRPWTRSPRPRGSQCRVATC